MARDGCTRIGSPAIFTLLEQWRGLATRYDELALIYRGAVVLAAVLSWTCT